MLILTHCSSQLLRHKDKHETVKKIVFVKFVVFPTILNNHFPIINLFLFEIPITRKKRNYLYPVHGNFSLKISRVVRGLHFER